MDVLSLKNLVLSITVLIFIALVKLGLWQLDRAVEKDVLIEQRAQRSALSPLTPSDLETLDDLEALPLSVRGELLYAQTLLLDNQVWEGRVGYRVIVPLQSPEPAEPLLLVDLGWVAAPLLRSELPALQTWAGALELLGRVHIPKANPYMDAHIEASPEWPKRISGFDFAALHTELGRDLRPYVLRLDADSSIGYLKQWLYINMGPQKHRGYALTWFSLAAALLILCLCFALALHREKQSKEVNHEHS